MIQGKGTEQVIDITEPWDCLCLPLPPFLSSDGDRFGEMTPSRPPGYFSVAVILLHWVIFQTYFKSPFLLVRPSTLFIFLPLRILNSDLHTKSCFIFVKLSTPKQQNEAIYFHIQVSPNMVFMRKISTFATEKKRE